jgi:hypothetical protein
MAVTNVAELNALVERVKKPSVNMPVSLKNKLTKSSAPPLWLLQMLESLSLKWPLPNPAWVSLKIK